MLHAICSVPSKSFCYKEKNIISLENCNNHTREIPFPLNVSAPAHFGIHTVFAKVITFIGAVNGSSAVIYFVYIQIYSCARVEIAPSVCRTGSLFFNNLGERVRGVAAP